MLLVQKTSAAGQCLRPRAPRHPRLHRRLRCGFRAHSLCVVAVLVVPVVRATRSVLVILVLFLMLCFMVLCSRVSVAWSRFLPWLVPSPPRRSFGLSGLLAVLSMGRSEKDYRRRADRFFFFCSRMRFRLRPSQSLDNALCDFEHGEKLKAGLNALYPEM